jgi:hypothetical protein
MAIGTRILGLGGGLAVALGCATTDARFADGQRALASGAWQRASEAFAGFAADNCHAWDVDARCKEAQVDLGEALLQMGKPKRAYLALEAAKALGPFTGPVNARLYELEKKAQDAFATRLARAPGQATLLVTFESQTSDRFRFQGAKFLMDLHPLPTDPTPYVAGAVTRAVPVTAIPAGDHELEVTATYESGGRLPPGYHFTVQEDHGFSLSPGASGELHVRVFEKSPEANPRDALDATFGEQGSGLSPKAIAE